MAKEKKYNPVQAQHRQDKKRQVRKIRKERLERREERAARANPEAVQRQIDELRQLESSGRLNASDRALLIRLQHEIPLIQKARAERPHVPHIQSEARTTAEQLREEARLQSERKLEHAFRTGKIRKGTTVMGKDPRKSRYYDAQYNPFGVPPPGKDWESISSDDESATDDDARDIPMPHDTPPTSGADDDDDEQEKRVEQPMSGPPPPPPSRDPPVIDLSLPAKPPNQPVKKVYTSEPVLRNLAQEAVAIVPTSIRRKRQAKNAAQSPADGADVEAQASGEPADRLADDDQRPTDADARPANPDAHPADLVAHPDAPTTESGAPGSNLPPTKLPSVDPPPAVTTGAQPAPRRRRLINTAPDV